MATDSRTRRASIQTRAPRSATADVERCKDAAGVTPEERARLLRDEFKQEALPEAPPIPGHHTCWLAVDNKWDPIHKRARLGYVPVLVSEVPSMADFRMATGQYEGAVSCNEMVLFKIPNEAYAQIMREYHHDAPLREEESLRAQLIRGGKDSEGKELETVEGFDDIGGQQRAAPHFA